jgi:predicted nucleic acid-binding protein
VIRLVLDCSVAVAWCFEDESDRYAEGVMDAVVGGEALVPCLWHCEVVNALVVAERRGRLTPAKATRFLESLKAFSIVVNSAPMDSAELLGIARERRLSAYDAAYLRLAMREGLPLATRDAALDWAARSAGVERFEPSQG